MGLDSLFVLACLRPGISNPYVHIFHHNPESSNPYDHLISFFSCPVYIAHIKAFCLHVLSYFVILPDKSITFSLFFVLFYFYCDEDRFLLFIYLVTGLLFCPLHPVTLKTTCFSPSFILWFYKLIIPCMSFGQIHYHSSPTRVTSFPRSVLLFIKPIESS